MFSFIKNLFARRSHDEKEDEKAPKDKKKGLKLSCILKRKVGNMYQALL
jgi:hypothetical protein